MKIIKGLFIAFIAAAIIILNSGITPAVPQRSPSVAFKVWASTIPGTGAYLKWISVPGAARYSIFRSKSGDSAYIQTASVYGTTYIDRGLEPSASYKYIVKAYNLQGAFMYSSNAEVFTQESKSVLGFTTSYSSTDNVSYNSLLKNSSMVDQIATYTYTADNYGNLHGTVPSDQVSFANSHNIIPMALITNNFSGSVAKTLLESQTYSQNFINNVYDILSKGNYKGVNIDMEGIFYFDRSYFTSFMNRLYTKLHSKGYVVTVDVPAKILDNLSEGWSGAYDYGSIFNYADKVVVMTYDEHYSTGAAGPIASIGWVKKVIDYTLTVIPKEKVLLGTAAYGYDWSSKGVKAYGIDGINSLASSQNKQILWDDASKTPYFNYIDTSGVKHYVWFENGASLSYKLDIVNDKGLAGIAIWKLGFENSDYWNMVKLKLGK